MGHCTKKHYNFFQNYAGVLLVQMWVFSSPDTDIQSVLLVTDLECGLIRKKTWKHLPFSTTFSQKTHTFSFCLTQFCSLYILRHNSLCNTFHTVICGMSNYLLELTTDLCGTLLNFALYPHSPYEVGQDCCLCTSIQFLQTVYTIVYVIFIWLNFIELKLICI